MIWKSVAAVGFGIWLGIGTGSAQDDDLRSAFPKSIQEAGVLRVGVTVPQPPFVLLGEQSSSEYRGIDIDLARAVAEKAGLKVEFKNFAFAGLVPALQAGQVDILWSGLLPTKERQEVANFVVYFRNPFGVLVQEGNPLNVKRVADLCGRKVALVKGSTPPAMIVKERQAQCAEKKLPPIDVIIYPDGVTCQLAIRSGSADAWISAGAAAAFVAATADEGKAFDYITDPDGLAGTVYFADGVAVPRDNKNLLEAVQKGLQAIIDDGTYLAVLKKYGQEEFAVTKATINTLE